MKKVRISYERYGRDMRCLLNKIEDLKEESEWTHVVGVATGGLPIATHVAKRLALPLGVLFARRSAHLSAHGQMVTNLGSHIEFPSWHDPMRQYSTFRPLFVDDMVDSGATQRAIASFMHWNAITLKRNLACLYARKQWKDQLIIGKILLHNNWIVYPWEV